MTTNFTSNTYPAYLALTVLQKIIDGQALPEAPLSVEIRKPLETPDDEINSFLSDIRAAYNVLNNLEEAARCFAVYQCAPACLNIERLDLVGDLYRFLPKSDVSKLIEAAASDLDSADDRETCELFTFDETQALITDLVNLFIDPLDIKKYFDEDGKNCGAYVLVECNGPTLYVHWLDEVGAYVTASGRTTSGSETRRLDFEDLEIINDLYFSGSLDI